MYRGLASQFRKYLWHGHDGVTVATGGRGLRHLAIAGSVLFMVALAGIFPVLTGDEPEFLVSAHADEAPHPLIGKYCMGCHDSDDATANIAFDEMSLQQASADGAHWEAVLRRLNSGMMPPAGVPRPSADEAAELISLISERLDEQRLAPEPTVLRRLTRTEYRNVIRDLLDLDVDVVTLLPPDPSSHGFDNIGEVLTTSPALVEGYLNAGMKVSRLAIGDTSMPSSRRVFTAPNDLDNTGYLEGLPLGTRGGVRTDVLFPLDGEYVIEVRAGAGPSLFHKFGRGVMPDIDLTVDGRAVSLDEDGKARVRVRAGERPVTAALRDVDVGPGVDDLYSVYNVKGAILEVAVNGPFNATGPGNTPSRRKIFTCHPRNSAEEPACARQIVSQLASKAFRHPVSEDSPDLAELMAYYNRGRENGGDFEDGIQRALSYILVDPRFLYKIEYEPAGTTPGDTYQVTPIELASRLSFFLWSSMPDEELMASATSGKLADPAEVDRQVQRMLADPKAIALVDNFGRQWLRLGELQSAERDSPFFDGSLRAAMTEETRLLLRNVMLNNRPVLELLDADYAFVNERLARHYGFDGVRGDYFRRVAIPAGNPRRGLLGQASLLTVTSVANRTSPVIRGAWVMENIMGVPPSPPPPGVETNLDEDANAPRTLRERLAKHREDPVCASCHNMMDPIGLSLENFDNTGHWREFDGQFPIDATSSMVDGTALNGMPDLTNAILQRSDSFLANVTAKLMTYALGRPVGAREMPFVRSALHTTGEEPHFGDLVRAIVASEPFVSRTKPGAPLGNGQPVQVTNTEPRSTSSKKDAA